MTLSRSTAVKNYASSQLDALSRKSREFEWAGQCGKVLGEESRISAKARKYSTASLAAPGVPSHSFVTPAAFAMLVEILITIDALAFFGQLLNGFKQLRCSTGYLSPRREKIYLQGTHHCLLRRPLCVMAVVFGRT